MSKSRYQFSGEVREHGGTSSWHFVSLPASDADDILERFGDHSAGFGSIRVEVTVGSTCWRTSIFPDAKDGTYVLPVKKAVRLAEDLRDGTITRVDLLVIASVRE